MPWVCDFGCVIDGLLCCDGALSEIFDVVDSRMPYSSL